MSAIQSFLDKLGTMFSGAPSTCVGVSIGSSAIKIVELKKQRKGWKLLHFGMVQLPDEVIVNREIVNSVAVSESLRTLLNQLNLKNKTVCTSISGTGVLIKRLSVVVPNAKELQDQIFWEAEQYLPFDVTEVVMDYHIISRAKDGRTDVVLVAVKKSIIETYMQCLMDAGLKVKMVDVDYFALQHIFETNYPAGTNESVAIVDIGSSGSKIVVVHDGVPIFTKDVALGGRNLTVEIQKQLNLTFNDAETLKTQSQGGVVPQEVNDLSSIMADNFGIEIKRALDFFMASSPGAPIGYVLLSGGCSKLPRISQIIEEKVGKPVQVINPFNAITYDPAIFTPDYIHSIGAVAAIPMGLALRMGQK